MEGRGQVLSVSIDKLVSMTMLLTDDQGQNQLDEVRRLKEEIEQELAAVAHSAVNQDDMDSGEAELF